MPRIDDLTRLLAAVAAQDWAAAQALGREIANGEERIGHHSAAQQLRGALLPNVQRGAPGDALRSLPLGDTGFLSTALTVPPGSPRLADVALRPALRVQLNALVTEWTHRDVLERRGIRRRRRLLFHGPPGCGKSLAAHSLGTDIGLKTFVVRIDSVVGAYLGQTALRIRELFRFAEATACVLLLDEIDALGKRRGSQLDVGELDRVVISLMQELEHAVPSGLVIATSNLPRHLDPALYRRFDDVLAFPRPSLRELRAFAAKNVHRSGVLKAFNPSQLARGAASYADVVRRVHALERTTVLNQVAKPR